MSIVPHRRLERVCLPENRRVEPGPRWPITGYLTAWTNFAYIGAKLITLPRSMAASPPDAAPAFWQDLHPPLSRHEAAVEADRCYFCHDAPCVTACPTDIDVPLFIRQISTGNPAGSARTILAENILGGMCARVCPTETLCEQACVRNTAEDRPVRIGELQRYATDHLMAAGVHPFERKSDTGKRVAVVGAGPAGLSCAHRLAMHGHAVTVFDALPRPGGLNEYGIAAYKAVDDFAQAEVDWLLMIGGIQIVHDSVLGVDVTLDGLKAQFDALFLGMGLGATNELDIDGESLEGVIDAIDFIARLRQSPDPRTLDAGERVVVVGGGMTAIDAAVQSKLLGAAEVTVAYRRAETAMNASGYERNLARTNGVAVRTWLSPKRVLGEQGRVRGIEFDVMSGTGADYRATGETLALPCDRVLKAIGQLFVTHPTDVAATVAADAGSGVGGDAAGAPDALPGKPIGESLTLSGKRLQVDAERRTSDPAIWAGGDCAAGGEDLTVAAVQDGKLAAESIHRTLMQA